MSKKNTTTYSSSPISSLDSP